jgi:eukaryotic-like serine/threonine-protein kinase
VGKPLPAPVNIDDFLQLVRRSGLVGESRLSATLDTLPPEFRGDDPARLAAGLVDQGVLTAFQTEQLLLGKCRGFEIGQYRILERLGSGGMALVYLCEDPNLQCRVAVKVLPNARAQDLEFLKRFHREAKVAAALDHANIVRTFDIDHDGKVNFLVMEYIDGALLHDIVHRFGPLPVERAANYIRQAALGLQHAHEAGLVHRDIKPSNLILDRSGIVKLLDMGLARNFLDESEEVLTRGVLGTPDYLAPEQSRDSHNVDIRADIYSLGCTFYYLLTGAPPFPEGSVAQKLLWHQTRPPTPVRSFRPEVPEGVAAVLHRMLAKDPAQRFQTPAEVAEALSPWTQELIAPPSNEEMPQLSLAARGLSETADGLEDTQPQPGTREPTPPPVRPPAPRRGVVELPPPADERPTKERKSSKVVAPKPSKAPAAQAKVTPRPVKPPTQPAAHGKPRAAQPKTSAKPPAPAGRPAPKRKEAHRAEAEPRPRRVSWAWVMVIGVLLIAASIGIAFLLRWWMSRHMLS